MCLEIKLFSRRKTAKEDIVCWKVMSKRDFTYVSLTMKFAYIGGVEYKSELRRQLWVTVHEGFHSFKRRWDAKEYEFNFNCSGTCVVRCHIPKGAKYYKGITNSYHKYECYASDTIIIDGEV